MYSRSAGDAADPTGDENTELLEAVERRQDQFRRQTVQELEALREEVQND